MAEAIATRLIGPQLGEKLEQYVYRCLHNDLLRGRLAPGERVNERDIAQRLRVSRAPVSRAIKRLEVEGYLQAVPRWGTYVRKISVREYLDMFEVREAIEVCAARRAAADMSDPDLDQLRAIADKFADGGELPIEESKSFVRYTDIKFHTRVLEGCGNSMLGGVMRGIFPALTSYFGYSWPDLPEQDRHWRRGECKLMVRIHHEYADVLAERDPDHAEAIVRKHVREKLHQFRELIDRGMVSLEEQVDTATAGYGRPAASIAQQSV